MPGIGASGLLTVEEVAGVRTCGKAVAFDEETEPPAEEATAYGCISKVDVEDDFFTCKAVFTNPSPLRVE